MLLAMSLAAGQLSAQKKPLDHSVYDGWESIQERVLSNNGEYVAFTVNPQEGDGRLVLANKANSWRLEVPRGYMVSLSADSRYAVFKIKPTYQETREARIKKKRPDDMPKDSLGIMDLRTDSLLKIARVKSVKTPEKGDGQWLAYHLDKALPEAPKPKASPDSLTQINNLTRMADSLMRVADSIRNKAQDARTKGLVVLEPAKKETKPAPRPAEDPVEEGTELVLRNLATAKEFRFKLVNEYYFSESGNVLLVETSRKNNDSLTQALVLWVNTSTAKVDTVMRRFNDARNYGMDEAGTQLSFVAERDSASKSLSKFYRLWYYKP